MSDAPDGPEKVVSIVRGAQNYQSPGELDLIYPEQWEGQPIPERRWLIDGVIPMNSVTMISGTGGAGKSTLTLQLQAACALDEQWLGLLTHPGKSIGVYCEDDADELHRRMYNIARYHDCKLGDFEGQIALVSRVGLENGLVDYTNDWKPTDLFNTITETAQEHGAEFVVLDSLHDLFLGNENSRPEARYFINALHGLALAINGSVILNSHPSRAGRNDGSGESGSTAWDAAVRSRLYLEPPSKDEGNKADLRLRTLSMKKANYSALESWPLEWRDGVFVRVAGVETAEVRSDAERRFLDCLDEAHKQGRPPASSKHAGDYAPRLFARMKLANGTTFKKLEQAMDRLFDKGAIHAVERGPQSKRKQVIERAFPVVPGCS